MDYAKFAGVRKGELYKAPLKKKGTEVKSVTTTRKMETVVAEYALWSQKAAGDTLPQYESYIQDERVLPPTDCKVITFKIPSTLHNIESFARHNGGIHLKKITSAAPEVNYIWLSPVKKADESVEQSEFDMWLMIYRSFAGVMTTQSSKASVIGKFFAAIKMIRTKLNKMDKWHIVSDMTWYEIFLKSCNYVVDIDMTAYIVDAPTKMVGTPDMPAAKTGMLGKNIDIIAGNLLMLLNSLLYENNNYGSYHYWTKNWCNTPTVDMQPPRLNARKRMDPSLFVFPSKFEYNTPLITQYILSVLYGLKVGNIKASDVVIKEKPVLVKLIEVSTPLLTQSSEGLCNSVSIDRSTESSAINTAEPSRSRSVPRKVETPFDEDAELVDCDKCSSIASIASPRIEKPHVTSLEYLTSNASSALDAVHHIWVSSKDVVEGYCDSISPSKLSYGEESPTPMSSTLHRRSHTDDFFTEKISDKFNRRRDMREYDEVKCRACNGVGKVFKVVAKRMTTPASDSGC